MSKRCTSSPHSSVPLAIARLPGYKWLICERGYANIVELQLPKANAQSDSKARTSEAEVNANSNSDSHPATTDGIAESDCVYGLLYALSSDDEATLDMYEGCSESRNPYPTETPDPIRRQTVPWCQDDWDYNKHYVSVEIVKWLGPIASLSTRGDGLMPEFEGLSPDISTAIVLAYIDEQRVEEGRINQSYIGRMNRGIRESVALGLPESWVEGVMRRWVTKGVEVRDENFVGTSKGYIEGYAPDGEVSEVMGTENSGVVSKTGVKMGSWDDGETDMQVNGSW